MLLLSYKGIVTKNVLWLLLTVPWAGLQYVIVVFPDQTHLLFEAYIYQVIHVIMFLHSWASTQENLSSGFANNKGTDQPAHWHSLISAFVIRLLESILSRLATSEISIL